MQSSQTRTVSYTLPWDTAPLDLSFLFEQEAPAGKHGFLRADGQHFVFEDGTPARFWGTNFNSAANFPTHEYAEIVARRLAMFGMNIVRFHQLDGDWSTPNIFCFTRGRRINDTRKLDPESMDRLDYLIYALKKNGIYVYLDNITYRRFREADGVENAAALTDAAKPQGVFDERMIELQKEYISQLWNHYNPYTKLAYKDDPVIVMTEVANECDLFIRCGFLIEPYRTRLEERFQAWRKEHGLEPVETPVDFADRTREDTVLFKYELQKHFFEEMDSYMKSIGIRIPIAGTNWFASLFPLSRAQTCFDFVDQHTYFNTWTWKPHEKLFRNESLLPYGWPAELMPGRLADRPFFISEWDVPWPNEYRSEGPLMLAAACCFQGWDGAAVHTYRYDCRPDVDMIAVPVTGEALSGISFRSGVFDSFNDPCRFSLYYHAALMVRRGDVAESPVTHVVKIDKMLSSELAPEAGVTGPADQKVLPIFDNRAPDAKKIAIAFPETKVPAGCEEIDPLHSLVADGADTVRSETGELFRDMKRKIAVIDTPRTKAAFGFLGACGEIELKGLKIRCRNPHAVIALSSLSDAPLAESDNILLTALDNCDNTDAEYNDDHTIQYSKGHGPVEAAVVVADIELETSVTQLRVDAINTHGLQVGRTPATYENGVLKFTVGGDFPSVHYLIQKL